MSIKAVRDHFYDHFSKSPFSKHWNYHLASSNKSNVIEFENKKQYLEFRKFNIEDFDKCAELYKEVFSDYPWYDEWDSVKQAKTYLMELIKSPVFEGFVIYDGSQIAAACFGRKRSWWTGNEFFIDEFFVSREKQGNGMGTKLMDYVKDSLRKEEYKRLTLLTNKGIPAEEFYFKNGFYNNENRIVMINELCD
ncbi:MAG: N-acetyltransferase family protein [Methanobacterium sp.]